MKPIAQHLHLSFSVLSSHITPVPGMHAFAGFQGFYPRALDSHGVSTSDTALGLIQHWLPNVSALVRILSRVESDPMRQRAYITSPNDSIHTGGPQVTYVFKAFRRWETLDPTNIVLENHATLTDDLRHFLGLPDRAVARTSGTAAASISRVSLQQPYDTLALISDAIGQFHEHKRWGTWVPKFGCQGARR